MNDIITNIERIMKSKGWTAYKLAQRANISQAALSRWFCGKTDPSLETLKRVCDALGITLAVFFSGAEPIERMAEHMELIKKWNKLNKGEKNLVIGILDSMSRPCY